MIIKIAGHDYTDTIECRDYSIRDEEDHCILSWNKYQYSNIEGPHSYGSPEIELQKGDGIFLYVMNNDGHTIDSFKF
jgi:hypothetical protein